MVIISRSTKKSVKQKAIVAVAASAAGAALTTSSSPSSATWAILSAEPARATQRREQAVSVGVVQPAVMGLGTEAAGMAGAGCAGALAFLASRSAARHRRRLTARAAEGMSDAEMLAEAKAAAEEAKRRLSAAQSGESSAMPVAPESSASSFSPTSAPLDLNTADGDMKSDSRAVSLLDELGVAGGQELTGGVLGTAEEGTPAHAILTSRALRKATEALVALKQKPDMGDALVGDQIANIIQALVIGGTVNYESLVGGPDAKAVWADLPVSEAEAQEAYVGVAKLLSPKPGDCIPEDATIKLTSDFRISDGLLEGTWDGSKVEIVMVRNDKGGQWGDYTAYEVTVARLAGEEVPALVGKRAVTCRAGGNAQNSRPLAEAKKDDEVLLTSPDRAACLDLIIYDLMPDTFRGLVPLLEAEDNAGEFDPDRQDVPIVLGDSGEAVDAMKDPRVKDAVRFTKRLTLLTDPDGTSLPQAKARLERLRDSPVARQVTSGMKANPALMNLYTLLEPDELRVYAAARARMQGFSPDELAKEEAKAEATVINLEFNIFQLVGAIILIGALAYGAANAGKPNGGVQPASDSLPMYSLSESRK